MLKTFWTVTKAQCYT